MKLDFTKINISDLESVCLNADSSNEKIDDDILKILGEGAENANDPENEAENSLMTVKNLAKELARSKGRRRKLEDFPSVVPEDENPDILVRGRWLERGGSAFIVSTAGTGKSILVTQFALSMVHGLPVCGLESNIGPMKCWIVQSEDSDSRVAIDRDDIIAGLEAEWRETHPEIIWKDAAKHVEFLEITGYTGSSFLEQLRNELEVAREDGELPDVIIINPFMDFLGADVTSNEDTIAFLSGGSIGGKKTEGLRSILKAFKIAALIVHHTGKPPSDKELPIWITSAMPEYKACGASYITNWGRSFVTMLKIPGLEGFVMLTAGKNGAGLGWQLVEGGRRIFLKWVDDPSCGGSGTRHYWSVVKDADEFQMCAEKITEMMNSRDGTQPKKIKEPINVKNAANYWANEILKSGSPLHGMSRREFQYKVTGALRMEGRTMSESKMVVDELFESPSDYGLKRMKNDAGKWSLVSESFGESNWEN